MRRRERPAEAPTVEVPERFRLADWLVRSERPEWSTPEQHERHLVSRAYLRWLGARREQREREGTT